METTAVIIGHQIVSGISDGLESDMKIDKFLKMSRRIAYLSGADRIASAKRKGKVLVVEGEVGDKSLTIEYEYRKDVRGGRPLRRDGSMVCNRDGSVLTFSNKADCFNYIVMDAAYTFRMLVDKA